MNYNLRKPKASIKNKFKKWSTELRAFWFVTPLVLVFKKTQSSDKAIYDPLYLHSKADNESVVFEAIYATILSNLQKYLEKYSG